MIFNLGGGGGSAGAGGFELTVVDGFTKPAKVSNNTIWVNTGIEMSELNFSQQNTVEDGNYNEGTVWIVLDVSGTVKMSFPVGDNWITMYPVSAKQFVNGEWILIEAHIYQDGMWEQFSKAISKLYLYNLGDTCDSVTGGWAKFNSNSTITYNSGSMTVRANGNYSSGGAKTVNTVDVTDFNTLVVVCSTASGTSFSDFAIRLSQDGTVGASTPASEVASIDVSELSGKYTVEIYCNNAASGGRSLIVSEIYLIRHGSSGVNLFANGTDATSLTGGWSSKAYSAGSGYVGKTVAVNISSEGVCATLAGTSYHSTFIGTNNKINVADYSTLKLEFSEDTNYTKGSGAMKVALYSDAGYTIVASSDVLPISGEVNLSPEIDVSTLSGEYYIGYFMWTWGTCTISAKMTKANLS